VLKNILIISSAIYGSDEAKIEEGYVRIGLEDNSVSLRFSDSLVQKSDEKHEEAILLRTSNTCSASAYEIRRRQQSVCDSVP
jgi:hypothetical protein